MRIQSGICMELNHDRSIFLVKNGRFVEGTPTGTPAVGEEASFYPHETKPAVRWQPIMAPVIAAIAAVALFISVLAFPAEEAFSYVQVEINPGIELGINDQYEVVSVRELNSDGHDLIHELGEWENDSLLDVLNKVFEIAVTEQTEQITITSVEEEGSERDQSIEKVVIAVSSVVENEQVTIQMKEATREQWRQSKENLVPVGDLIDKAETLKLQKEPEVQAPAKEAEPVPVPKEKEPVNNQETPSENSVGNPNQETNDNKETKTKKETNEIKPDEKTEPISPAGEKKNDKPSPKEEKQQKTPKQNNKADESSKNSKNTPSVKKQQEIPVPKENPSESKEKERPADEDNERGSSEAPGQQKKKDDSAANSSAVEKESHNPPGQEKKKEQDAGKPGKEKKKEQQRTDTPSEKEVKQGNPKKE